MDARINFNVYNHYFTKAVHDMMIGFNAVEVMEKGYKKVFTEMRETLMDKEKGGTSPS